MNTPAMLAYLEPAGTRINTPFDRYRPDLPCGMTSGWVKHHFSPGDCILDPIGGFPAGILEIALAGYNVLVAVNNPVAAFELSALAKPLTVQEMQSALRDLGLQKKGSERLESHIQNLYLTRCSTCNREVVADAYLWRRNEVVPYAKMYSCPSCGNNGEHPTNDADYERLALFKRSDMLHRARALEKLPSGTEAAQANLEELLKLYPPRPLYVIFTLLNKLEGMEIKPSQKTAMDALLLAAMDAAHCLWPAAAGAEPPRLPNPPAEYVEHNLWKSMEKAPENWCRGGKNIPLSRWPEPPAKGGISLYQGRMRDLLKGKNEVHPATIVCALPRPSQVFWSLSTLWSCWLWGKENTANFRNVLERQRFDWYWHANALNSALAPAARMVKAESLAFLLLPDPVPGFVSSAFEAASSASLELSGVGWKDETHPIQIEWQTLSVGQEVKKVNLHKLIREGIQTCLMELGEPARYLKLYTAVNVNLSNKNAFPPSIKHLTYETVNEIHAEINKQFSDKKFLRRLDATAQDFESGYWWLVQAEGCQNAISDRVENELLNLLFKENAMRTEKIQETLNSRFTGFLTPSTELLIQCLRSYCDFDAPSATWKLKPHETKAQRDHDVVEMTRLLQQLAGELGYIMEDTQPLTWKDAARPDHPLYRIILSTTAVFNQAAGDDLGEETRTVFLFPGSRSALLRHKLDHDGFLREKVSNKWHFLKFRTLRDYMATAKHSPEGWKNLLYSDPIRPEETIQLSMFGF